MLDIFAIRELLLYCIALSVLHLQILSEQVFLPGSHTFPPLVQQDYIYKIAQTSVCTAIKLSFFLVNILHFLQIQIQELELQSKVKA